MYRQAKDQGMMDRIKDHLSEWFAYPPHAGWWWVALFFIIFAQGLTPLIKGAMLAGMGWWGVKVLNYKGDEQQRQWAEEEQREKDAADAERVGRIRALEAELQATKKDR